MDSLELSPLTSTEITGDAEDVHSAKDCAEDVPLPSGRVRKSFVSCCTKFRSTVAVIILLLSVALIPNLQKVSHSVDSSKIFKMAFGGNSMLYYNDCPKLMEILLQNRVNSFIRGGANLDSLWRPGGDMPWNSTSSSMEDLLLQEEWDFVVLQDNTPDPTHPESREMSLQALREHYLPALKKKIHSPILLLLEPFPFQSPRLRQHFGWRGGFDVFSNAIEEGYREYSRVAQEAGVETRIVPMSTAMQQINLDGVYFDRMYYSDGIHPSPHATWLQACLIFLAATGKSPPVWSIRIRQMWQHQARFWQHDGQVLPLPSMEEAEYLRQLSCNVVHPKRSDISQSDWCRSFSF